MNARRLPIGWKTERHKCDLPFSVYFTAHPGDIWECHHCHREWMVRSVVPTGSQGYDRFILTFELLIEQEWTRSE